MIDHQAPLRIMHAISSDRFAGVEQFVRRLAIRQAQDGHDVHVIGGAAAHMESPLSAAGVAYEPAATLRAVFHAVRSMLAASDVVNTHMTDADIAVVAARISSRADPAIVSTRHFAQRRGSIGPRLPYRFVERRIDAEISISKAVAAAVEVPSTVVYPGVERVAEADPTTRRRTVLVAQRLQPEKHTALGLRAFAASGLASLGWVLEIAGSGSDEQSLRTLADGLAIAHAVRFLGFRTDLPRLMSEAGILLATSPFEHFGLTVLESMGAGLPVVAADAAGHAEMLGGLDERALFTPDDVAAAAQSLRALANDREGRTRLGSLERDRQSSTFTLSAQADGTLAVYLEAIAARKGQR